MANRWGNIGNSDGLYFGGSKITVYGDCNHEIKRCLLLGRKFLTNLKSRDITLITKYGFSSSHVWRWELDHNESWALKNWCFWTVVLEKTLENPWTARRSNQPILKEIYPGCSLEGLMLKLKLQYFGTWCKELTHCKKTMMLGKVEVSRSIQERMRWLDAKPHSMDMSLTNSGSWRWTGKPGVLQSTGLQSWTLLSAWTDWLTDWLIANFTLCIEYFYTVIKFFELGHS